MEAGPVHDARCGVSQVLVGHQDPRCGPAQVDGPLWLVFEDEAGFSMTPPQARTWSQRGRTPVVRVRGRSRRRICIAALTCFKPGHRSRLIYRPRRDDGRRDGRKSFSWRDYRDLLIAAHRQLGGPIVLVWDDVNVHKVAGLREFAGPCCGGAGSPTSLSARQNTSSSASDAACATSSTAAPHRRLPRRDGPDHQTHVTTTTTRVQPRRPNDWDWATRLTITANKALKVQCGAISHI